MVEVIRRFKLDRQDDETGISGTGVVAVGAVFPTGRVVMEWLPGRTEVRSFNIYQSIEEVRLINGHNGRTRVVFEDEE